VRFERDELTGVITGFSPMLLFDRADITGDMLEQARPDRDNGEWIVSMSFNPVGAQIFGDVTSKNVGKLFAIVLDGRVMLSPRIKSAITGGSAQIELGYGEEAQAEAKNISLILKEGALPARLSIESQSIIGPSLGQDAIDAGLKSVSIAALIVIVFMMIYYKAGGFIANLALILNVVMIFAIMSLFGASLSLPGIAGIVLTMGMAVDANVIIFERMREEKYRARTAKDIIHSGYSNAMSAILDGNITTFFSGLVLFQFGTGPIKGFATTLMIGIVTTVFTAVVVTQVIYEVLLEKFRLQKVSC
jgi:preprotein translocase subunit SecD